MVSLIWVVRKYFFIVEDLRRRNYGRYNGKVKGLVGMFRLGIGNFFLSRGL